MKNLIAIAVALFASAASAQGIAGNPAHPHNLLAGSTAQSACDFCHMPHFAAAATTAPAPLWAKNLRSYTQVYNSQIGGHATIDAGLNPLSQACLSCHDGTVGAVNQVLPVGAGATGNRSLGGTKTTISNTNNVGTDLTNDHPVSLTYNGVAGNPFGLLPTPAVNMKLFTGNKLECGSCHEPHEDITVAGYRGHLLRGLSTDGDFCGQCHSK